MGIKASFLQGKGSRCLLPVAPVMLLAITALICVESNSCFAAQNPTTPYVQRWYRTSQNQIGYEPFSTLYWNPNDTDWDEVVTTHNSVKFAHHYVQDQWPQNGHTADDA
ncbi:hypothetical protein ACFL34_05990, partial [Candidatus Sumerlaeota bacterium]